MSAPTNERGGRRKRLFTITFYGQKTLEEIQAVRANLWGMISGLKNSWVMEENKSPTASMG